MADSGFNQETISYNISFLIDMTSEEQVWLLAYESAVVQSFLTLLNVKNDNIFIMF